MGTNFYRVLKVTQRDKDKLKTLIDEGKILGIDEWSNEPVETVHSEIHRLNERVHLCKRSRGWQICFDHNWGKYYLPSRKSITEFLSQPDTEIQDEYGEVYTVEEFWKEVDEHNANEHSRFTAKTYREWGESQDPSWRYFPCYEHRKRVRRTFGIVTDEDDFEVDGLRFAVYSDFS